METIKKSISLFTLRPAIANDAGFLYQLYCTTREDELNAIGFPPEQRELFLRMQFDAQKTHYEKFYPDAEHQIITVGEKSVGRKYVDRTAEEIRLVDIALMPECRGGGIGTTLLNELCNQSIRAGKPLRLHAVKLNSDISGSQR